VLRRFLLELLAVRTGRPALRLTAQIRLRYHADDRSTQHWPSSRDEQRGVEPTPGDVPPDGTGGRVALSART